jgi:large subunit ribosomal protein L29
MKIAEFKKEVKSLSTEDIAKRITTEKRELQRIKFAHALSPIEGPMAIRTKRRNIARLQTELRERDTKSQA